MHVGLLECDHVEGRFPEIAGGYREMFGALLSPHLPGLRFNYYDVCHGELPPDPGACDAWLCSGSRASVYEPLSWIPPLQSFLRRLHGARRPVAGICFGHQVLAHALGGEVVRAPGGWGVGVHDMDVLRREAWMRPVRTSCRLPYMHQDQVRRLPDGAVLLGRSAHCEIAMFRAGETMLGIEGHPEFPRAYSAALIRARAAEIGAERARLALTSLEQESEQAVAGAWIAHFLAVPSPAGI